MIDLSLVEIVVRVLMAVVFGGLIGYEREIKGQSAGFRTHMLVCVGAVIISLIQIQTTNQILNVSTMNSDFGQIISADYTRLIAQIVSGVGFLGAGAIIVTKKSVSGLATAASIWVTAGIGIAVGMGYYAVAIIGTLTIYTVLSFIKTQLGIPGGENLSVHYLDDKIHQEILSYFNENEIKFFSTQYRIDKDLDSEKIIHSQHYTLNIPTGISIFQIIQDISELESVIHVSSQDSF